MTRVYYKDTAGAIIVFDATNMSSFEAVEHWRKDLKTKLYTEDEIPIILLANKFDCVDNDHPGCVTESQIDEYCKANNIIQWFKCSAKNGTNIIEPIQSLIEEMVSKKQDRRDEKETIDIQKTKRKKHR